MKSPNFCRDTTCRVSTRTEPIPIIKSCLVAIQSSQTLFPFWNLLSGFVFLVFFLPASIASDADSFKPEISSNPVSLSNGDLLVTVETVREQTPKKRSILAKKVEIWEGEKLLSSLSDTDKQVESSFHHRIFRFPLIPLKNGYHFITIRAYAEGFISRDLKWKGRIIQVGIHSGRTTKLQKTLPFFVW